MATPDKVVTEHQTKIDSPQGPRLTQRSVRSFVVRNGRVTRAQEDAITRLLPKFGIEFSSSNTNLGHFFGRQAPIWLEIGFGNGDVLLHMARENPHVNILGVEVHTAGVGHALLGIEKHQLSNVRLVQHDAMEVLEQMLSPASIDRILLLFPDPWHKKRHHKRRIVQKDFTNAVATGLVRGGLLHCATDWEEYAHWMLDLIGADPRFMNISGNTAASERPSWRPVTRFEKRGERLGHSVTDLIFTRTEIE